jgi:tetratricopeptide (TPR) repeat protein
MSKKLKFTRTTEGSDRKALSLADSYERKELSDREYLDRLEELSHELPRGVMLESLYVNNYLKERSYDRYILRFLNAALEKHPDHPALAVAMIQVASELGLDAFFLHYGMIALEFTLQNTDGVSGPTLAPEESDEISILADHTEKALEKVRSSGYSWSEDETALVALDQAVWESMLGLDDDAKKTVERALVDRPGWLPALRIRAKIAWDICDFDTAHETWSRAAESGERAEHRTMEAFALILEGRENQAVPIVDALLGLASMKPDPASFLQLLIAAGKGAEAYRVFGPLVSSTMKEEDITGYFVHLAAGMALIAGDEARAAKLWRRVKDGPFADIARENLRELKHQPEVRIGPFLFRLIDLVPRACRTALESVSMEHAWEYELGIDRVLGIVRTRAPGLMKGLGRMLLRYGDLPSLRYFVRRLVCPWFPELDSWLLEETRSADIPPARRTLIEHEVAGAGLLASAGRMPEEPKLSRWIISREPHTSFGKARQWNEKGFDCFRRADWKAALACFRSLTEMEPDDPAGWNNLRYALEKLGRNDEVDRLGLEMAIHFPAYIQTQVSQARKFAAAGNAARALRILDGLLARDHFHPQDLRLVLHAELDIHLANGDRIKAARYLDIWESFETDTELLEPYVLLRIVSGFDRMRERYEKRERNKAAKIREKMESQAAIGEPPQTSAPGTESSSAGASGSENDRVAPDIGTSAQQELF